MARRDGDKLRQTSSEAAVILGPKLIMEKDSHSVEPVQPGPAELGIDAPGVKGVGLKHLELIDGVRGDVVRADEPSAMPEPAMGFRTEAETITSEFLATP
jgi:hypothetical protein